MKRIISMNTNPSRAEIIETLCELGSHYQFPEKSAFITLEADAHRSPADPQRALEALVQEFGAAALVEAGMARGSREGPLQFVPALACPDTPFVVLHGDDDGRPFGLVTAEGCWGHQSPPLLAGLEDRFTASNLRKSKLGNVYVSATVEDMILLRSLGFAATTAAGLTKLSLPDVRTLGRHFGMAFSETDEDDDDQAAALGANRAADAPEADSRRTTGAEIEAEGSSPRATTDVGTTGGTSGGANESLLEDLGIVLVAWSPSRCAPGVAPSIAAAEKYLTALSENFDMSLTLTTWLPTHADRAEMEFAIAHRSWKWLRKKMLWSVQHSYYKPLDGKLPQAPTLPLDYADAVGRLLGPAAADKGMIPAPNKPQELLERAQQLLERDVIRPIIDQAIRTPDRIEGTLMLGLAELSRVFHTQGLLLGRKLSQGAATMDIDGLSQVSQDGIKQFIALAGRMQGMAAEICRQRKSVIGGAIECQVISPPSSPRLLGSH